MLVPDDVSLWIFCEWVGALVPDIVCHIFTNSLEVLFIIQPGLDVREAYFLLMKCEPKG